MLKKFPNQEGREMQVSREMVIDAYRKFVERGITNPDELDLNDSDVKEANKLFDKWQAQEENRAGADEESEKRFNLARTMLYIDTGFTHPEYLKDVLGWLAQDSQNAGKIPDDPERAETRLQIAEAMKKIRSLLVSHKS